MRQIVSSYIYGIIHSRSFWKTHNPVSNPCWVGDDYKELEKTNKLRYLYVTKIFEFIRENSLDEVIFLGCAYGDELVYANREFPDIKLVGCDISTPCIEYCKRLNLKNTEFVLTDLNKKSDIKSIFQKRGNARRGIVTIGTLTFIYPAPLRFLLKYSAEQNTKAVLIQSNVNAFDFVPFYDLWKETKSRYSGNQGAWNHPYIHLLKKYYTIYEFEFINPRLCTKVHFYLRPFLVSARDTK